MWIILAWYLVFRFQKTDASLRKVKLTMSSHFSNLNKCESFFGLKMKIILWWIDTPDVSSLQGKLFVTFWC